MLDALYSSISGLNGFEIALNNQANNVANVNTIAYKADTLSFADQMYQNSIGSGVSVSTIKKDFNQGELKVTGSNYDLGIEGKGFFMAKGEDEEIRYTRAGNFYMAADGTLQLPGGHKILGLPISSSSTITSDLDNTMFTGSYSKFLASQIIKTQNGEVIQSINAKATDYVATATDDSDVFKGNDYKTRQAKINDADALAKAFRDALLTYSENPIDGEKPTSQSSTIPFNMSKLNSEFDSLELTIGTITYRQQFDTSALQTLENFADTISKVTGMTAKVDSSGNMTIASMVPGQKIILSDAAILNGTEPVIPAPVISTTAAVTGSGKAKFDTIELELKKAIERAGGKYLDISTVVDSTDLETKTFSTLQMQLDKLNLTDSQFGTVEFDNGVMYMAEGNNKFVIGRVSTAAFINEGGLAPQGNNLYKATDAAGLPVFATNQNKILSKTIELSNTDLSKGLVDLMVFQRAYEANSKTLSTSDEFLKTALALKK